LVERVAHLKKALVEKLKPWMEGRVSDFETEIRAEVAELRAESYGAEILQHVRVLYFMGYFSNFEIVTSGFILGRIYLCE
jgi:hypothetical protein